MALVLFREYRDYEDQRVLANDAMMGLLAGSKLAIQTLQLTTGSTARLSQIFPSVPHIARFDLQVGQAAKVLEGAESYLAALCVPFVFSAHENLIKHCMLHLASESGLLSPTKFKNADMSSMHDLLAELSDGRTFTPANLSLFDALRCMRNVVVHSNGIISEQRHLGGIDNATADARALWRKITHEPYPSYRLGERLNTGLPLLIAALATTLRLAEEANLMFQGILPRSKWLAYAVDDWRRGGGEVGSVGQRERRLRGFARHLYGPLGLTAGELSYAL
jgi:hypothetical protein